MSAKKPAVLDAFRRAVEAMIIDGADFAAVEASIVAAPLTDDERDALWVHAWSQASQRDRDDFSRGPAHGRVGALAPRARWGVAT